MHGSLPTKISSSVQCPRKKITVSKCLINMLSRPSLGASDEQFPSAIVANLSQSVVDNNNLQFTMNISTPPVIPTGQVGEAILKIMCLLAGSSKGPNSNVPTFLFQEKLKSTVPSDFGHRFLVVTSPKCSNLSALKPVCTSKTGQAPENCFGMTQENSKRLMMKKFSMHMCRCGHDSVPPVMFASMIAMRICSCTKSVTTIDSTYEKALICWQWTVWRSRWGHSPRVFSGWCRRIWCTVAESHFDLKTPPPVDRGF